MVPVELTQGYQRKGFFLPHMQSSHSVLGEARASLILALPLMIGQVCQMLISVSDTLMIGQLGVVPLAASTFANTMIYLPFMFGIGMAIAVSVHVSQARGANDPDAARTALRHGLFVTLGLGVLTVVFVVALLPFLPYFGQKPEVIESVPTYFVILAVSMIPAMGSMAVKNHSDALNRPWPAFGIMFGGVVLNVVLNWVFIYGNLGAPRLELEGAGIATLIARSATLLGLLVLCTKRPGLREWVPYHWFRKPEWPVLRSLVKIGLPASLQILAEVSAFVAATLIIGSMSVDALAAHQVAITCAATIFMVPLGLSQALTVRMGEALGAKEYARWRPIVISGWVLGTCFTLLSATAFVLGRETIAAWFLPSEPETAAVVVSLLLIAAFFQIGDALQIVSAGALRGISDVKGPAWISFLIYWGMAIPLGWYFSFSMGMGVKGMWWSITIGLGLAAFVLGIRLWRKTGEDRFVDYQVMATVPTGES